MLTRVVFLLIVVVSVAYSATTRQQDDYFDRFNRTIIEYFKSDQPSEDVLQTLQEYKMPGVLRNTVGIPGECFFCSAVVEIILLLIKTNLLSQEKLENSVVGLCNVLEIESDRVCRGTIHEYIPIFWYIATHRKRMTSQQFCGVILQSVGCELDEQSNWTIEIPADDPIERNNVFKQITEDDPLHIIHISDIHYDPVYLPSGNGVCNEPICCQYDQSTDGLSDEELCGFWTDYRKADSPWHLLETTIQQINTQPCDYVYFTGDIISHRVWQTSAENNSQIISKVFRYLFDNLKCPLYPVLGNHEPHPLNVFAPEYINDTRLTTKWLFELIDDLWSPYLDDNVSATILKGGYYTISPRKGFRIIALNNNVCYTPDFWLIYDDRDPFEQLKWLVQVLDQAERDQESVHILAHVPSGESNCLYIWSEQYNRIVERYANTITAQFDGHTHRDEFHIYYNSSDMLDAISVAFNGASITPYDKANPSYKIHLIDHTAYTVLDSLEWTFNLTLANEDPSMPPQWYQLYSFRETYGIANLQAKEVGKIPQKMLEDHSLLDDYFRYYYRNGDAGISEGCNDDCKKELLCGIVMSNSGVKTQCNYFMDLYV